MDAVAKTMTEQETTHKHLRPRILRPYSAHAVAPLFGCHLVSHKPLQSSTFSSTKSISDLSSSSITIRLQGTASDNDQYGNVKELAEPVANELDLFKARDGDQVRSELRIVEVDFLQDL